MVHEDEEEDDEATEDGLITRRRRVTPSSPPTPPPLPTPTPPSPPAPTPPVQAVPLAAALPAVEAIGPNFLENPPSASTPFKSAGEGPPSTASIAEAAPGGDEGAHNLPIIITKSPTSPPRQEVPIQQPIRGESQHQAPSAPPPTAVANLPLAVKGIWEPFTAKLRMMAEDLTSIISKAVESSSKKLQDNISVLQEENRLIRIEAEKLSFNLMLAEIDHSRVEDAMSTKLRVARKEAIDLRHKVHLLAQEKIELESKLVPYRLKVASLEASIKANAAKVENLEKRSVDREVLLGKVEKERDDTVAKLAEARKENERITAELA